MTIYLLRNGALAMDLERRSGGCLYVHRVDLGCGCWIPTGLIRLQLKPHQVDGLTREGYIPLMAPY
ncbi:MAG: hypothetical protein CMJ29_10880 [Phycisphaerae bacterium]|nr:hypothetical protein [Phycisphaerae bacterium]